MLMFGWQLFVLVLLTLPWMLLTRRMPVPIELLRRLTGVPRGRGSRGDSAIGSPIAITPARR